MGDCSYCVAMWAVTTTTDSHFVIARPKAEAISAGKIASPLSGFAMTGVCFAALAMTWVRVRNDGGLLRVARNDGYSPLSAVLSKPAALQSSMY